MTREQNERTVLIKNETDAKRTKTIVLLGLVWQFQSFLLACMNVFSELLTNKNWDTPTLMNFPMYLSLYLLTTWYINHIVSKISKKNLNFGYWLFYFDNFLINNYNSKKDGNSNYVILSNSMSSFKLPAWYYILGAIADVEGNTLLLFAYQFTTITSVSLLDFFSIAVVVILSIIIFERKYNLKHYLSILLCLIGIIILVISDKFSSDNNDSHGKNPILGDILTLIGATCYGFSNTFEEYAVTYEKRESSESQSQIQRSQNNNNGNNHDNDNYVSISPVVFYLRAIGYFGSWICLIQGLILEYNKLMNKNEYSIESCFYYFGYYICLTVYYILIPILLQYSTAVVMNLSLLTSDLWSLVAGILLFNIKLNWLYFVASFCIIIGVIWYNSLMYINNRHLKAKIGNTWLVSEDNSVGDSSIAAQNSHIIDITENNVQKIHTINEGCNSNNASLGDNTAVDDSELM